MTSPVWVDIYEGDLHSHPNLQALVDAGLPWAGISLKATEGTYYPKEPGWFKTYWPLARSLAGDRNGETWFRWCYHYYRVGLDPVKQADFYLGLVDAAGGWVDGDMWPMIDVEGAENPPNGSAAQIEDEVSKLASEILRKHGRAPVLYGGSYLRDLKITSHMGCQFLITAAYGSALPSHLYKEIGWPLEQLLGWQFQGTDGYTGPDHYPRECPLGSGPLDLIACTIENGKTQAEQLAFIAANIWK